MSKKPKTPRGPRSGQRQMRVNLRTARRRTASSQRWLERQLNDPYVAAARREGYRSRAAYKLIELAEKYRFIRPGCRVVDLGAAPGGWSQVAADRVKSIEGNGQVVAIDYLGMEPIAGVEIVEMDFTDDGAEEKLIALLRGGRADIVLSDMAAPTVGHKATDHVRIMALADAAADFATRVLEPGGTFLAKVLQGGTERQLLDLLKRSFSIVRHVKPPASRSDSAELYVLATGFKSKKGPEGPR